MMNFMSVLVWCAVIALAFLALIMLFDAFIVTTAELSQTNEYCQSIGFDRAIAFDGKCLNESGEFIQIEKERVQFYPPKWKFYKEAKG